MTDKVFDVDIRDKCLHKHLVPFPHSTTEDRVKYLDCQSSDDNNITRGWCNTKVAIVMLLCSIVWCGLLALALPTVIGVGGLTVDGGSHRRAGAAGHGDAPRPAPAENLRGGSSLDDRLAALEGLASELASRVQELEKRNRELELAVVVEHTQPQTCEEKLEQLIDQLERGMSFLFPDFKMDTKAGQLAPVERAEGERVALLRDYLGNKEAELAALRPDLVPGLRGRDDGAASPPDLGTIGLALQQLSSENAELTARVEELNQRMLASSRRGQFTDADEEIENVVREILVDEEERYLDESERTKAADTRKSAFSVASSQPQLGLQGEMQYVTFDFSLTNKGGDFHFDNNSFVCRIPGFYFFTITLRTYDHRYLGILLMKNDEQQVAINTDQSERSISSTQTAILRLSEGDSVWLRMPPSENYGIYSDGSHYTTFSGFLVFSTAN